MAPPERTAVLGIALGYQPEVVRPFIRSLRGTGYDGDVVLVVTKKRAPEFAADPDFAGVELVHAKEWAPNRAKVFRIPRYGRFLWTPMYVLQLAIVGLAGAIPPLRRYQELLAARLYHPWMSRYFYYREIVERHDYDRVMFSDVRDVVFQSNPFEACPATGLSVSLELDQYTIATEVWNSIWIRALAGQEMLDRIGGNPVSCAGVTLGDRQAIRAYLDTMIREIVKMPRRLTTTPLDQGIHNLMLWTGRLGEVHTLESLGSPVATLNGVTTDDLRFDDRTGRLVNRDGSPISIVHQYDRIPGLAERLEAAS